MLFNSVHDDTLLTLMPKTTAALASWDGKDLPDEAAYAALVEDLKARWKDKNAAEAGKRINYEIPGARSQVLSSARQASKLTAGPYKPAMIEINPIWGQPAIWSILKRGGSRLYASTICCAPSISNMTTTARSWPPRRRTRSSATSSPAP